MNPKAQILGTIAPSCTTLSIYCYYSKAGCSVPGREQPDMWMLFISIAIAKEFSISDFLSATTTIMNIGYMA